MTERNLHIHDSNHRPCGPFEKTNNVSAMKSSRNLAGKLALTLLSISILSGCATAEWAHNDEWKKKTGWEYEKPGNYGWWGTLVSRGLPCER